MIDLRSDTVTKPTPAMRQAMAQADVGDDVYGEDPTCNALEASVARALGHEAGLFCPSGIAANQIGLRQLAGPGQEILAESSAHILRAEVGALAGVSGVTTRTWRGERGLVDLDQIADLIAPRSSPYLVATAAIAVENTHNFGGGTVQPLRSLQALRALADEQGLLLHLDGARLWNAHVATGIPLDAYGRLFDTVSVCFSKGLGAPVGSVLVSTAERIQRARVARRMTGGAMRQVGILAAAAEYAWRHHLADLAHDHDAGPPPGATPRPGRSPCRRPDPGRDQHRRTGPARIPVAGPGAGGCGPTARRPGLLADAAHRAAGHASRRG